jgi:hypothetical protein
MLRRTLWAKTTAEHGAITTEEAQTLLSRKKILNSNITPAKIYNKLSVKTRKNIPVCNLIQKAVVIAFRSYVQQLINTHNP